MSNYFYDLAREEQLLKRHGFDCCPDEVELARYVFDLEDALDALCEAVGVQLGKDVRGRWQVYSTKGANNGSR